MTRAWLLLALLLVAIVTTVEARERAPVRAFRAEHPCPATGETRGRCPGYVVDHVWPLCGGGADDPSNMQWQEITESRQKDLAELALCRWLRKSHR